MPPSSPSSRSAAPSRRPASDDLVIDLTDPVRPRALRGGVEVAPAATAADVAAATADVGARARSRAAALEATTAAGARSTAGVLLSLAALFTLVDAMATYAWLQAGHGEWNPLLDALIHRIGAGPAMAWRAAVGLGLLAVLAPLVSRTVLARRGLLGVTIALGGVCAYHLYGLVAHVLLV